MPKKAERREWRRPLLVVLLVLLLVCIADFALDAAIDGFSHQPVPSAFHALPWALMAALALGLAVDHARFASAGEQLLREEARGEVERREELLERYRELSESTSDAVLFVAASGAILECNRAAELLYGCSSSHLQDLTLGRLAFDPHDDLSETLSEAQMRPLRLERVQRRSDGTAFDAEVLLHATVLGGQPVVVATIRDVSARRAAERALRESEGRYRSLVEMAPYAVAVCQDGAIISLNQALLRLAHVDRAEDLLGRPVLEFVHPDTPPPTAEAFLEAPQRFERRLVRPDGSSLEASIMSVPITYDGVPSVQIVIDDISERKRYEQALRTSTRNTIAAMARLTEARDPYTSGHQGRVARLSQAIARELGLPEEEIDAIEMAANVHDIGKMHVPIEILAKPGRLTEPEMDLVRAHPVHGAQVLEPIGFVGGVTDMVLQHHERLDGSGYPGGLAGDEIVRGARVIAVADVLEAAASHRPYRPALGLGKALEILREGRSRLFDDVVVDACERVVRRTPGLVSPE